MTPPSEGTDMPKNELREILKSLREEEYQCTCSYRGYKEYEQCPNCDRTDKKENVIDQAILSIKELMVKCVGENKPVYGQEPPFEIEPDIECANTGYNQAKDEIRKAIKYDL